MGRSTFNTRLPLLLQELWITPVQHYLFLSAGVLSHVDKKRGIILNHSLLRLQTCLGIVFRTSYKKVSTSSSTTILLAIVFLHSLRKVSTGHGPVSALYQD